MRMNTFRPDIYPCLRLSVGSSAAVVCPNLDQRDAQSDNDSHEDNRPLKDFHHLRTTVILRSDENEKVHAVKRFLNDIVVVRGINGGRTKHRTLGILKLIAKS